MDDMKQRRLQELDRSDFEIVKGEPDIRGWDVKNTNGQKIGEVEELILDAKEKKVRYMVVDLDDNQLKLNHRKVLLPIGLAELDKKDDDVLIPSVSPEQFNELPVYDRNQLTADVERRIFSTLDRTTQSTEVKKTTAKTVEINKSEKKKDDEVDSDFYGHEYYNVDNLYKNRLHEAQPVNKNESEYERGLRLWERRSEGGILAGETRREAGAPQRDSYREIDEQTRMETIKNRRDNYRQRRYHDEDRPQSRTENLAERDKSSENG
jgi:sporulation protein YlmC with PRC-barrel domain